MTVGRFHPSYYLVNELSSSVPLFVSPMEVDHGTVIQPLREELSNSLFRHFQHYKDDILEHTHEDYVLVAARVKQNNINSTRVFKKQVRDNQYYRFRFKFHKQKDNWREVSLIIRVNYHPKIYQYSNNLIQTIRQVVLDVDEHLNTHYLKDASSFHFSKIKYGYNHFFDDDRLRLIEPILFD